MSSRLIVIVFSTILFSSCGVKGDPRPPQDTLLPSVESHYTVGPQTNEVTESEKNDKKKEKK